MKTIDKGDEMVNYQSLKIVFTELDARLKRLREEGGVTEYIKVEDSEQQ